MSPPPAVPQLIWASNLQSPQRAHRCRSATNRMLTRRIGACPAPTAHKPAVVRLVGGVKCQAAASGEAQAAQQAQHSGAEVSRRGAVTLAGAAAFAGVVGQLVAAEQAGAITSNPLEYKKELARKRRKIPESEFKDLGDPSEGLKYYDLTVGTGAEPKPGDRVAIHFDVKFRNVTFMTSRQGVGVTGGTPFGFDVGQPANAPGSALPGIDKGVRGMRVGGQRRLLVPPNLAYGSKGVGEIPGNATLQIDVELLSIKQSVFGTRVKLVEG